MRFGCVGDSSWEGSHADRKKGHLTYAWRVGAIRGARGSPCWCCEHISSLFNDNHKRLIYGLSRRNADKGISTAACEFIWNKSNLFHRPCYSFGLQSHFKSALIFPPHHLQYSIGATLLLLGVPWTHATIVYDASSIRCSSLYQDSLQNKERGGASDKKFNVYANGQESDAGWHEKSNILPMTEDIGPHVKARW